MALGLLPAMWLWGPTSVASQMSQCTTGPGWNGTCGHSLKILFLREREKQCNKLHCFPAVHIACLEIGFGKDGFSMPG